MDLKTDDISAFLQFYNTLLRELFMLLCVKEDNIDRKIKGDGNVVHIRNMLDIQSKIAVESNFEMRNRHLSLCIYIF